MSISLAVHLVTTFLSLPFFFFVFWKRLKDDYTRESIFSSGFIIFFSTLAFFILGSLLPVESLWFWFSYFGAFSAFLFVAKRYEFRTFEIYEAFCLSFFILFGFYLLGYFAIKNGTELVLLTVFTFLMLPLFWLVNKNYKKFAWYKSGRVGFAGLFVVGVFFAARAIAGALGYPMISLLGKVEFILSGVVSFLNFFTIYYLSES